MTRPTMTSLLVVRLHSVEGMVQRSALPIPYRPVLESGSVDLVGF